MANQDETRGDAAKANQKGKSWITRTLTTMVADCEESLETMRCLHNKHSIAAQKGAKGMAQGKGCAFTQKGGKILTPPNARVAEDQIHARLRQRCEFPLHEMRREIRFAEFSLQGNRETHYSSTLSNLHSEGRKRKRDASGSTKTEHGDDLEEVEVEEGGMAPDLPNNGGVRSQKKKKSPDGNEPTPEKAKEEETTEGVISVSSSED